MTPPLAIFVPEGMGRAGLGLIALVLVQLNILMWSCVGIYEAFRVVLG